jgi:hypothetical protein
MIILGAGEMMLGKGGVSRSKNTPDPIKSHKDQDKNHPQNQNPVNNQTSPMIAFRNHVSLTNLVYVHHDILPTFVA